MAITLTQNTYRLWARIGPSVSNTQGGITVTDSTVNVLAQLAQMAATNLALEGY